MCSRTSHLLFCCDCRFGRSGLAINFVDGQRSMQNLRKIEEHFNRKIERLSLDDPDEIEQAVAS